jgi:CheY-like chemotaxis protein
MQTVHSYWRLAEGQSIVSETGFIRLLDRDTIAWKAESGMEAPKDRWILVLEDDEDDLSLTIRALGKVAAGIRIEIASDGEEALGVLSQPDLPTLVLMDAHMPKVSGAALLHKAKEDPRLQPIPFVVFSSSIAPHEVRELINEGATDIVTKPLDYSEYATSLKKVVDAFLG